MPMAMFFFMRLGASPLDLGFFGFLMRGGSMLFSPVYGRCVDQYGIRLPLLVCMALCGAGCVVRCISQQIWHLYVAQLLMGAGGGSAWSMVKGYIASHTDEEQRPLLVSGLKLQMLVLSLTKVLYPALDALLTFALALETQMARFRAVISTCSLFCGAGIVVLAVLHPRHEAPAGPVPSKGAPPVATAAAESPEAKVVAGRAEGCCRQAGGLPPGSQGPALWGPVPLRFLPQAAVVAAVSCAATVCTNLWPLYLRSRFGWEATEYAYLSFADSMFTAAALGAYPRAVLLVPGARLAKALACSAAAAVLLAYSVGSAASGGGSMAAAAPAAAGPAAAAASASLGLQALHASLALLASALLGVMGPCVETLASLSVPTELQGFAMGALNTAASLGALVGHLLGAALWAASLRQAPGASGPLAWAPAAGRLPYLGVVVLLLAVYVLLRLEGEAAAPSELVQAQKLGSAAYMDDPETEKDSSTPVGEDDGLLNLRAAGRATTGVPQGPPRAAT